MPQRAVFYSSWRGRPFTTQTTAHQWILFITASMDDYAEQNRIYLYAVVNLELPWRKRIVKFPRVQQLILVLFPQIFFTSCLILTFFCRNIPEKNVKNRRCSWLDTYCWVPLSYNRPRNWYTIKAVVHMVNVKFRILKKNNVRNTEKTSQLK